MEGEVRGKGGKRRKSVRVVDEDVQFTACDALDIGLKLRDASFACHVSANDFDAFGEEVGVLFVGKERGDRDEAWIPFIEVDWD